MTTPLLAEELNSTRSAGTRPCDPAHRSSRKGRQESQHLTGTITAGQVNRQHALVILHFGTIRTLAASIKASGENLTKTLDNFLVIER
jgi:hypothetical protein